MVHGVNSKRKKANVVKFIGSLVCIGASQHFPIFDTNWARESIAGPNITAAEVLPSVQNI